MIRAIIIDDEQISLRALGEKIRVNCPELEVVGSFNKPEDAIREIEELQADVVFLDIEMPKMNGFTFLKNLRPVRWEVIFTTAYSEYAIEALRISALDFLTKPIDTKELVVAVERLKNKLDHKASRPASLDQQLQIFLQHQHSATRLGKIALPVLNGLEIIGIDEIIKIKGENVYSVFHLVNEKKLVVSINLKEVEGMLRSYDFFRVHKSYIINLKCITRYIKGEGGIVILKDGSEVEVSRRNKLEFLKRITARLE
ncbi:MAG TPA: LytTR family DNA-binding domain-containing protein [Puia sp.]|nr:LytTR family DNA-binding domain-containing protein [Puia sp.]